jgi:hypothetical protein
MGQCGELSILEKDGAIPEGLAKTLVGEVEVYLTPPAIDYAQVHRCAHLAMPHESFHRAHHGDAVLIRGHPSARRSSRS